MEAKKVILIIMDGWGLGGKKKAMPFKMQMFRL